MLLVLLPATLKTSRSSLSTSSEGEGTLWLLLRRSGVSDDEAVSADAAAAIAAEGESQFFGLLGPFSSSSLRRSC